MMYEFKCDSCNAVHIVDIPINEYTQKKDSQRCPKCNSIIKRVIQWNGIATGSGEGWCGNKNGNTI